MTDENKDKCVFCGAKDALDYSGTCRNCNKEFYADE